MMKYFFLFLIALVLSGEVAVAHPSPEFLAARNTIAGKNTELVSVRLVDRNAVAADGVTFETVIPDRLLTIPKDAESAPTPIEFGICITNNTSAPVRIRRDSLMPEVLGLNNEFIFPEILKFRPLTFTEADFPLIPPKQNLTLIWQGFLHSYKIANKKVLGIKVTDDRSKIFFVFSPKPGTFQIRLKYSNTDEETTSEDMKILESKHMEGVLTGRSSSPWRKIMFVDSENTSTGKIAELPEVRSTENNAVEVNGIGFEAVLPTRVFNIPENRTDTSTPIRLGLRITNQTSEPITFSSKNNLLLEIIDSNGKKVTSGGFVRWNYMFPTQVNFPWIPPGESFSLFWSGNFSWWNLTKLTLFISKYNGSDPQSFVSFKPGIYRIRFTYNNTHSEIVYSDRLKRQFIRSKRKALTVQFSTPWVEIKLVEP
jgi:hypothetical protein